MARGGLRRSGAAAVMDGSIALSCALWALACLTITPAFASQISVQGATYGANCGIQADNAGESVKALCDGQEKCDYAVNSRVLGDPKPGCKKDFVVRYICQGSTQIKTATAPAEAGQGHVASLDCAGAASSVPMPATKPPSSSTASDAHIGFEASGTCIGACPPAAPLQQGEDQTISISLEVKLANGDRFGITGQANITSTTSFGRSQFGYESPLTIQYLGNASGGPSQDDTITATLYRAWAAGRDGQIDIKPPHSAALSVGLGEGSSAEAGLSGSNGARWTATDRWPPAPHSQQNAIFGAYHYTVAIRDGVLNIWFRFGAHFASGSLPGSFILIDNVRPPPLTFAQLRRGEGFAAPPDLACPPGTPAEEALERAKRAARKTANVMAMRCFLSAADSGNAGAANDVGYAAEQGLAVVPDPQEAARWYRKAAEQGDTQAQDRLAHLLMAGTASASDLQEAKHWTQRADTLREARSHVCSASSVIEGMYQIDVAITQDPEMRLGQVVAGAFTGVAVRSTPRRPFLVKLIDSFVRYGQFAVDPLPQGGAFLCQGFYTRGDDQAVPLLDQNGIDQLRSERDAEEYGSDRWRQLDEEISNAQAAGGLTEFMNQQMKAHNVYPQYFTVTPLGNGHYRIAEINTPLTRTYSIEVKGPALDTPP